MATVSAYNRYKETYRTCAELFHTCNGKPPSGATKLGLARIANHGMPQPTGRVTDAPLGQIQIQRRARRKMEESDGRGQSNMATCRWALTQLHRSKMERAKLAAATTRRRHKHRNDLKIRCSVIVAGSLGTCRRAAGTKLCHRATTTAKGNRPPGSDNSSSRCSNNKRRPSNNHNSSRTMRLSRARSRC